MAALQYLETQRAAQPELAEWYSSLADLYQRKLWHQLTLKLDQFLALAVLQVLRCCVDWLERKLAYAPPLTILKNVIVLG